ncbi:hypothetical protein XAPC_3398 [Xanthomonas citri pv. punicae str. LMG 859]|nr:hypothetical protein XAPC_3398 [Xanthomonas citri pv. punicae str. LMG 859]
MANGVMKKPRIARFFRLWCWALGSRLCTVTARLKTLNTSDFVGHVMPIDMQ